MICDTDYAMEMNVTDKLLALRKERESLLLRSRNEKNTAGWKRRWASVRVELNAEAARLREERWKNL